MIVATRVAVMVSMTTLTVARCAAVMPPGTHPVLDTEAAAATGTGMIEGTAEGVTETDEEDMAVTDTEEEGEEDHQTKEVKKKNTGRGEMTVLLVM